MQRSKNRMYDYVRSRMADHGRHQSSVRIVAAARDLYHYWNGSEAMTEQSLSAAEPPEHVEKRNIFSLLGRAHTLDILKTILLDMNRPVRFGEFQDEIGLSPNTLSRRLDELVDSGFLNRTQYDEIPPRVEYEATEMLEALRPIFCDFTDWMNQYGTGRFGVSNGPESSGTKR